MKSDKKETERILWIDAAKGVGAILVLVGHLPFIPQFVKVWIYSFHMPLFFWLSGYTFHSRNDIHIGKFMKEKGYRLIVPYIFFATIYVCEQFLLDVLVALKNGTSIGYSVYVKKAVGILLSFRGTDYYAGYWFIPCFFVAIIMMYGICRMTVSGGGATVIIIVASYIYEVLIDFKLPWECDVALMACGFMLMGKQCATMERLSEPQRVNNGIKLFGAFCCSCTACAWNYYLTKEQVEMFDDRYGNFALFLVAAIAGIYMVTIFARMFSAKILIKIGRMSLYFYGAQAVILVFSNALTNHLKVESLVAKILFSLVQLIVLSFILLLCQPAYEKCEIKMRNRIDKIKRIIIY